MNSDILKIFGKTYRPSILLNVNYVTRNDAKLKNQLQFNAWFDQVWKVNDGGQLYN